jgi:rSAM/selenodomain-associated transferase 2
MISIIIPVFNEELYLSATLAAIKTNESPHEIIVVDAGSSDASINVALDYGARVLSTAVKQRADQMNRGAQSARGNIFVFLHADTRLPRNALAKIESAIARQHVVGGGFARRYDSPSWFLRGTCALAEIRTRLFGGWFLGDQAIFVRRGVFDKLGGFRDLDLFEDLDFSRRMRCEGRLITLRPAVTTSSRRFALIGPVRTTWMDLLITWRYLRGADPNRLAIERDPRQETQSMTEGKSKKRDGAQSISTVS